MRHSRHTESHELLHEGGATDWIDGSAVGVTAVAMPAETSEVLTLVGNNPLGLGTAAFLAELEYQRSK